MKFIDEYRIIIEELMKKDISFKVNTENEMIEFEGGVYVDVEEDDYTDNVAVCYCVGARLREAEFDLKEVREVIDYVQEELDRKWIANIIYKERDTWKQHYTSV